MLSNDDSENSMGSMAEAAIGQHEMYLSWVAAGFTPEQALELLKTVVTEILRGNS